jgi:flavodoxin short chain
MEKVLILYGSLTGNTKLTAELIKNRLEINDNIVDLIDISEFKEGSIENYDLIILGCSTWGSDSIGIQDDFLPFYNNMVEKGFKDKRVAVFGCGESSYKFFCGAVDSIEEKIKYCGGLLISSSLKIDGDPENRIKEIENWAFKLL